MHRSHSNPFDTRNGIYSTKAVDHALFEPLALSKLNSQRKITVNDNYHELTLAALEQFVETLLGDDYAPFLFNCQARHYQPASPIANYFSSVPDFIRVVKALSDRYQYSEYINVFIVCTRALGLLDTEPDWHPDRLNANHSSHRFGCKHAAAEFNDLVYAIRNTWKTNRLQAKVNSQVYETKQRLAEYLHYVNALFDCYARLVVIRIDLFYQKQLNNSKSATDITQDLNHLIENKRCNGLFDDMVGYIAKLEYGSEKGLHWHLLLFFDGSKRCHNSHSYLAKSIGDYWKHTVTQGQGDYWNVNAHANEYQNKGLLGIGTIHYYDRSLRDRLNAIVGYLCKSAQYFRPNIHQSAAIAPAHESIFVHDVHNKIVPKVRLYRRGQYPKMPAQKLGRPRQKQDAQTMVNVSM